MMKKFIKRSVSFGFVMLFAIGMVSLGGIDSIVNASNTTPQSGATETFMVNYDDDLSNGQFNMYYASSSDQIAYAESFNLGSTDYLISGMKFKHLDSGSSTHPLNVVVYGDGMEQTSYSTNVPYASTHTWYSMGFLSEYIIDNDPEVQLYCTSSSTSDCIGLSYDTDGSDASTSFYYENEGPWALDTGYDYLISISVESIIDLTVGGLDKTGEITSDDFVDAYYVTLSADTTYEFDLSVTSGLGDLNMYLKTYTSKTGATVASASLTDTAATLSYTPDSTTDYILIIEPEDSGVDIADYSVGVSEYVVPTPITDGYMVNIGDVFIWETKKADGEIYWVEMEEVVDVSSYSVSVDTSTYYMSGSSVSSDENAMSYNYKSSAELANLELTHDTEDITKSYGGRSVNGLNVSYIDDEIWDQYDWVIYDKATGAIVEIKYASDYETLPDYTQILVGWTELNLVEEYNPEASDSGNSIGGYMIGPFFIISVVSIVLIAFYKKSIKKL